MQDQVLTAEAQAAIAKVEKLLTLARNAGANENEAQSALDAAHRILEQHNLDMALVERRIGDSASPHAKRQDKTSSDAFRAGERAGEQVGLDRQIDQNKTKQLR